MGLPRDGAVARSSSGTASPWLSRSDFIVAALLVAIAHLGMEAPPWSGPQPQPQVVSDQQRRSVVGVETAAQPSQAELQRITELLHRWSNGTRRAVNGPRQALPGEIQQLQGLVKEMQQLPVVPCLRNARDGMAEGMERYTAALLSHLRGNAGDDEIARLIRAAQTAIETNVVGMLVCRPDLVVVADAGVKVASGVKESVV